MQTRSGNNENGWREELEALRRRVGELERQVAQLHGSVPKLFLPAEEIGAAPMLEVAAFAVSPPPPRIYEEEPGR